MSESLRALALLASALLWAGVGVAWAAEVGVLARLRRNWQVCPPLRRALAALAVAAAVAYAGGKGEGAGGEGVGIKEQGVSAEFSSSFVAVGGTQQDVDHHTYSLHPTPCSLSDEDISRGYRLVAVATNEAHSYEMPPDARLVGTWHLTDAYDAVAKVFLEGAFPLGGQVVTSLWAHVWGKARPQLGNASNELVAVGAPMYARRGVSRLWTAATTNGSVLLTWQDFSLGNPFAMPSNVQTPQRPNAQTVSAQLELFRDGSFVARSNSVARAYRRVNPDDWDGDGIPNAEDDDPRVAADEPRFGPRQSLPQGAHTNNYYWVDLVVRDADALVFFAGDAPSNLSDPSFVARAGETNRVTLLIGKLYTIHSLLPAEIVGTSDPEVEVGRDGARTTVCRPIRCEIVAASATSPLSATPRRAATGGRRLRFTPEPVGADVTWNANYCCLEPSAFPSGVPLYNCDGSCGCGGCAVGTYTCRFEGFELSFPDWPCGCPHVSPDEPHRPGEKDPEEPHGAFASASFSASSVVFEDAYEDTPGVTVPWRSTEAEAEFAVSGGPGGSSYRLELRDGGRLVRTGGSYLPREGTLGPGETFRVKVRYGGRSASGAVGDVVARATVTEEGGEGPVVSEATLTAVRVEVAPVVLREGFPNRHRMGVRERFAVELQPTEIQKTVHLTPDWLLDKRGDDIYICPIRASGNGVEISVEGVSYTPDLRVVEPTGILCESGFDRCRDGVVAMELEPYVTPLDVSFFGVRIMEVPTAGGAPAGYFANPRFEPIWNHTQARGAGVWHRPGLDNFFFADEPSFGEYCPPPLSAGVIDWAIPLAWGEPTAQEVSDVVGTMGTVYRQVFTLDASGGLRIDKFSQWIHCTAEGAVTHSPGIRRRN